MRLNRQCLCALAYAVSGFAAASPAGAQMVRLDHLQEHGTVLRSARFPFAFRGHWSVDLRECGQAPTEDTQLWITAELFNFYETRGKVTRIVVESADRIVATLRSQGEGISFTSKKGLTLSADRNSLTVRDEDDTGSTTFNRCPATDTAPSFIPHHTMP